MWNAQNKASEHHLSSLSYQSDLESLDLNINKLKKTHCGMRQTVTGLEITGGEGQIRSLEEVYLKIKKGHRKT